LSGMTDLRLVGVSDCCRPEEGDATGVGGAPGLALP